MVHALDVLGRGLLAHEQDLLTLQGSLDRLVGGEGEGPAGRSRRGRQTRGDDRRGTLGLVVEPRQQQLGDVPRRDPRHRRAAVDEALLHHLDGDPHRGGFTGTG